MNTKIKQIKYFQYFRLFYKLGKVFTTIFLKLLSDLFYVLDEVKNQRIIKVISTLPSQGGKKNVKIEDIIRKGEDIL